MALVVSPKIREKLATKHSVTAEEVAQCFANMTGRCLTDTREDHATDPPTLWFIAETDYGRKLKVVFVRKDGDIFLKSAFVPNATELSIYRKFGG